MPRTRATIVIGLQNANDHVGRTSRIRVRQREKHLQKRQIQRARRPTGSDCANVLATRRAVKSRFQKSSLRADFSVASSGTNGWGYAEPRAGVAKLVIRA